MYEDKEFLSNRKNMMKDGYWLPPRKAWLCRLAGLVFLIGAAVMLPVIAFAGLTPGASPGCGGGYGCVWEARPVTLIDSDERLRVEASPAVLKALNAFAAQGRVRLGLAGIEAINALPFAALLFSVGVALRRLGGRGADPLQRALPWLRRASIAAIVWTLAHAVYQTALESWLSPGTPAGPTLYTNIYLADIATGLLLAIAAYCAIWAIEAGLRAQRDLDDFV